jgi:hypothetical protein
MTSQSTWQQQALDSIKDDFASCEPALVARLAIFTRLASGEEMPAGEKILRGSWRKVRRSRPEPRHTRRAHLGVSAVRTRSQHGTAGPQQQVGDRRGAEGRGVVPVDVRTSLSVSAATSRDMSHVRQVTPTMTSPAKKSSPGPPAMVTMA